MALVFSSLPPLNLRFSDWYSGWFSYTFPIASSSAAHVIPIIRHWFTNTAVPGVLFSDQSPPYNSKDFQDFLMRWGVTYKCSSAEYPQGSAYAELAVKNCKRFLDNYYRGADTDWDSFDRAILQIRNTPHKSNNLSPAMLLYGKRVQDCIPAHKSLLTRDWHQRFQDLIVNSLLIKPDSKQRITAERSNCRHFRSVPPWPFYLAIPNVGTGTESCRKCTTAYAAI